MPATGLPRRLTRFALAATCLVAAACGGPTPRPGDDGTHDVVDAGHTDQQPVDGGGRTSGEHDAGTPAAGGTDGGSADAGTSDAGTPANQLAWPFSPGPCSPQKPASLDGPGVVATEDLCTRDTGYDTRVELHYGDNGYGSIGLVDSHNPWPDDDQYFVHVQPGEMVRVTVEATPGQDFQPALSATLNGCSIIHYMRPLPDDVHTTVRELFVPDCALTLDLMISDARATSAATYGAGARSTYKVRVDRVQKTPVTLAALPQTVQGDFTTQGLLGVYAITLPNAPGSVVIDALAQHRLNGAPASDVTTMLWLYRPASGRQIEDDVYKSRQDSHIAYEYDPTSSQTPPGTYWVVVDHDSAATRMQYDLSIAFEGQPANDVCAGAVDATPAAGATRTTAGNTRYAQDTFDLGASNASWTCAPAFASTTFTSKRLAGRDVVFSATVPAHQTLVAKVTPASGSYWNPALWLSSTCAAGSEASCVAFVDDQGDGKPESTTWTNHGSAPERIFVHVDASSSSAAGEFTLDTSLRDAPAVPANDVCAGVVPISVGVGYTQTATGSTESATNDGGPSGAGVPLECKDTGGWWPGADVVYSVRVPAGVRLRARATPNAPLWNPALWISSDCANAAPTCLGAQDSTDSPEAVAWTNRGSADQTVYVHVDSRESTGGAFQLAVQLDRPTGRDVCPGSAASPTYAFLANTKYDVNDYSFSASTVSAACQSAFSFSPGPWLGRDHVYSFTVPAGKRLSVEVKSPISFNGQPVDDWQAMLTTACGDLLTAGQSCVSAGRGTVGWTNATGQDATVYLFVDTISAAPPQADYNVIPTLQ